MDVSKGREILPGNVVPIHYHVTLEPNFKTFTYEGTVVVDLDVVEDSTSISLNTLELELHSTKVISGDTVIRSVWSEDIHMQKHAQFYNKPNLLTHDV